MKIGLFIPCYVDVVFPEVGEATWKLLKSLVLDVTYPEGQTCCGQPMANAGFERQAIPLAEKFVEKFDGFDYVALGHIHGPQHIGKETIRYCGTPLKYSFSEAKDKKSVTVVELREKGSVSYRTASCSRLTSRLSETCAKMSRMFSMRLPWALR